MLWLLLHRELKGENAVGVWAAKVPSPGSSPETCSCFVISRVCEGSRLAFLGKCSAPD